jgi:hypothetical protein
VRVSVFRRLVSVTWRSKERRERKADCLRCAIKALEIASDGFYDNDDIAIDASEHGVEFVAF